MNYQINTYFILISLILGFIISLFYVRKFNLLFLGNFIIISLIFLILFYFLAERKELFKNDEVENFQIEEESNNMNYQEENQNMKTEEEHQNIHTEEEHQNMHTEEEYSREETEEEHKSSTFQEELQEQEEHIRQSQEMEEIQEEIKNNMEEEENLRHSLRKKDLDKENVISQNIASAIPNTSGIGNLNINISCGGNNGPPGNNSSRNNESTCNIDTNNSRIYNNSDWAYNSSYWKNKPNYYTEDSYNYNKLEPCSKDENGNYLLPCIQPEANKIPQTLNNLLNARKTNENENEVCPLEINKPWSSYKTGDDDEDNKILPEGYNI